jgi:Fe-S oxidoreductase
MWDRIVRMEYEEILRLKARVALIGECGHASRSAKVGMPTFCGGKDAPPVVNIMEYSHRMLMEGKLRVRANTIKERVTYHDPCNIARSGWIVEQPREILRAICSDFVDMTPKGKDNYCCGGGSGIVSIDEVRKWRTGPAGKIKADQLRATGAKYLVSPCANCKKQLKEVVEDNEIEGMEVVGLHDLLIKAIDFSTAPTYREDIKSQAGDSKEEK